MFIIIGHDKKAEQVMVHDTLDHTTTPANYAILRKVVNKGYIVKGLDERGNIICNEPNVLMELKVLLQPIITKALLLRLDNRKIIELIFPICARYGLAEDFYDLDVDIEKLIVSFYLTGQFLLFKENCIEQLHSIKHTKDFNKLNKKTRIMLKELYKIPLSTNHSDLIVNKISNLESSYFVGLKCGVTLHIIMWPYKQDYTIELANQQNNEAFRYYLRSLAKYEPENSYFIYSLKQQNYYPSGIVAPILYVR